VTGPTGAGGATGPTGATGATGPASPTNFDYAEDNTTSQTTSTTFQQKLRLTTDNIPGGEYVIHYSAELNITGGFSDMVSMQVQVDDTTTLAEFSDKTRYDFGAASGFARVTLSTGIHNIDIDYRATSASYAAEIRRARIMLWKVP
jgi:hypothetical protein